MLVAREQPAKHSEAERHGGQRKLNRQRLHVGCAVQHDEVGDPQRDHKREGSLQAPAMLQGLASHGEAARPEHGCSPKNKAGSALASSRSEHRR